MNQQSKSFYQALRGVTESNVSKTLEVAETKTNIINLPNHTFSTSNTKIFPVQFPEHFPGAYTARRKKEYAPRLCHTCPGASWTAQRPWKSDPCLS